MTSVGAAALHGLDRADTQRKVDLVLKRIAAITKVYFASLSFHLTAWNFWMFANEYHPRTDRSAAYIAAHLYAPSHAHCHYSPVCLTVLQVAESSRRALDKLVAREVPVTWFGLANQARCPLPRSAACCGILLSSCWSGTAHLA